MGHPFMSLMSSFSVSFVKTQEGSSEWVEVLYPIEYLALFWVSFKGAISLGKHEKNSHKKSISKNALQRQALVEMASNAQKSLQMLILKMNLTLTWHWMMKTERWDIFLPGQCHWLCTASDERPHLRGMLLFILTGKTQWFILQCSQWEPFFQGSQSSLSKEIEMRRMSLWIHSFFFPLIWKIKNLTVFKIIILKPSC